MTDAPATTPVTVKASYRDGCVGLGIKLRCNGYGDSARIEGSASVTADQARALAQALIAAADKEDAKVAARLEADRRRGKWRDREIAAGRMVSMTPTEFLRHAK